MQKFTKLHYGYDAPAIVKRFSIYSFLSLLVIITLAIILPTGWISVLVLLLLLLFTISLFMPVITILLGSMYFKFRERDWLFANLLLQGDENVLDVGCGH